MKIKPCLINLLLYSAQLPHTKNKYELSILKDLGTLQSGGFIFYSRKPQVFTVTVFAYIFGPRNWPVAISQSIASPAIYCLPTKHLRMA